MGCLVGGLVVECALNAVALGKEILQIALVAVLERTAVGAKRFDQMVDLEGERVASSIMSSDHICGLRCATRVRSR